MAALITELQGHLQKALLSRTSTHRAKVPPTLASAPGDTLPITLYSHYITQELSANYPPLLVLLQYPGILCQFSSVPTQITTSRELLKSILLFSLSHCGTHMCLQTSLGFYTIMPRKFLQTTFLSHSRCSIFNLPFNSTHTTEVCYLLSYGLSTYENESRIN